MNQGWLDAQAGPRGPLLAWNAVSTKVTVHAHGPVLLAGADITQLLKQHPYGINDRSVQVAK